MDLDTIIQDRRQLQKRWSAEGYYRDKTMSEALTEGARDFPATESIFYADGEPRVATNRLLYDEGLRLASALGKLGIGVGDVVAVQLPTWLETALLYQAIAHVGAIVLPIVSIYGEAEVSFILRQSKAKALFVPAKWRKTDYVARCDRFGQAPDLQHIVVIGDGAPDRYISWRRFVASAEDGFKPVRVDPNDLCVLIYTSGTTSAPKGVRHTHNALLWEWGRPTYANRGLYLSNLPAGHITGYGFLLRPPIYGAPMVFMDHWDAKFAAELIQRHHIKCGGGTPIFLLTLLAAAEENRFDISSLASFSMGGQGITPAQVRMADEKGFPAARVYGTTEHPTVTDFDPAQPFEKRAYTDGKMDVGNEVRIVDEEGRDLPQGSEGEILTIGPELFAGYSDPELDKDTFAPGGWYRTGDIGRIDADGYLIITDRKKDIIIRGGENISSNEVEEILERHSAVAAAAAVAMSDKTYGEKVCAFVVLRQGQTLTLDGVMAHFQAAGVARQKTPERLEIVADMPRNASGKIKKHELRQKLRNEAAA